MEKRDDFKNSYYDGFSKFFEISPEEFMKYYDEDKYGGYPEECGGSVWESEAKSIYVLIRILKPKKILEIGNLVGNSSNHILQSVEVNGFGGVTLLDIEEQLQYNRLHSRNFNRVIDNSLNFLSKPFEYDLIIQDSNHAYNHVKKELELILENNKLESYYIWGHDFYTKVDESCGVNTVWNEMKDNFSIFQPFKDSVSNCGCLIAKK